MCIKVKYEIKYTVYLINNNINRDVQEECANGLYRVYTHSSNTDDIVRIVNILQFPVSGRSGVQSFVASTRR